MTVSTAAPAIPQAEVEAQVAEFVNRITDLTNAYYAAHYTRVQPPVYSLEVGPKFIRVVATGSQRSVHCFIEKATGKVIKAAGWKAPAKGKTGLAYRWDLMDEASREAMYAAFDPFGGYLYAR